MKRSEVNDSITRALEIFDSRRFPLPHWARWSPEDWAKADEEYKEVMQLRLGWDVTDFGSGDLTNIGRTIFTLRNGLKDGAVSPRRYAEKVMCLFPGQRSVIHAHRRKCEDIICRGGQVVIEIWGGAAGGVLSSESVEVSIDGRRTGIEAGKAVVLDPGMSICLPPGIYHRFWGEGDGPTPSVEISSVCDDLTDNFFLGDGERFPAIEEDEAPRWLLCSEYAL